MTTAIKGAAEPGGRRKTAPGEQRNVAVDWLRVGATGAVFLFHTARFFDQGDWHVKSPVLHTGLNVVVYLLAQWIMPLMFILSGIGAALALERGSMGRFVTSKIPRLLVPLLFGILALAPHQVYLERLTHGQFTGSFLEFLPHYFDGLYAFGGNFAWMGLHLWYLLVLFLFSVLLAPLLRLFKTDAGRGLSARLASFLAKPGLWLLLGLPIAAFDLLDPTSVAGTRQMGGWNLFTYLFFYLYGYLVFAAPQFQDAARRGWPFSLIMALLFPTLFVALGLDETRGEAAFALVSLLRGLNAMAWIMAATGLGLRYFNRPHRLLPTLSEGVLPFYMLHQAVLIPVGYGLLRLGLGPLPSYGLIAICALVLILGLYLFLIRPFGPMRFLFGMKGKSRTAGVRAV